ncbi:MAG: hypothetical protein ACK6DC_17840, partial [Planctomycetota bacterium]
LLQRGLGEKQPFARSNLQLDRQVCGYGSGETRFIHRVAETRTRRELRISIRDLGWPVLHVFPLEL